MASKATRLRVLALYKELHRLGRDYPDPSCVSVSVTFAHHAVPHIDCHRYDFHGRMRGMFESTLSLSTPRFRTSLTPTRPPENKHLTDQEEIEKALKLGEYIKNGEHPRRSYHVRK